MNATLRVAGVVVAAAAILLAVLVVARGRDDPTLDSGSVGTPAPRIAEPAGGEAPARDGIALREAQWRYLVSRGNVVVSSAAVRDGVVLRALQRELTGSYRPALAAAGQAVVIDASPERARGGVVARSGDGELRAASAQDADLRAFVADAVSK